MAEQAGLPEVTTQRELALERSQKVSRALHDAARKARLSVRKTSLLQPSFSRASRGSRKFALLSALILLVLPTLIATIYYAFIAADQFQVETQFAVRGGEPIPMDTLGTLTGFPALHQVQDSAIVTDYVKSRSLVDKLDGEIDLRAIFSRPEIDVLLRFDPTEPIEELVKYWRRRITISIEATSGVVTAKFRAFTAEDSLRIARAVLAACEDLVNDISRRSRQDLLAKAQDELDKAQKHLVEVREQYRVLRDKERLIDPVKSADAVNKMLSELRLERIKAENEYQVNSRSLAPTAPQMQVLKARLEAVSGQIANLERTLTTQHAASANPTLSQSFAVFDKARLDQEWAEKYYQTVAALYERAKLDAERQQVYLESFVRPMLPEQAEFPRRFWNVLLIALGATMIWFLVSFVRSLVKL